MFVSLQHLRYKTQQHVCVFVDLIDKTERSPRGPLSYICCPAGFLIGAGGDNGRARRAVSKGAEGEGEVNYLEGHLRNTFVFTGIINRFWFMEVQQEC